MVGTRAHQRGWVAHTNRHTALDSPPSQLRNHTTWDALVAQHGHRVVVALLAMGVRLDQAQDLAQQAWLALMERHGEPSELDVPGHIIAKARSLAMDAWRENRAERRRLMIAGEAGNITPAPPVDPAQQILTRERTRRALETVQGCSPSAQRVFGLLYAEPRLSHQDIARRVELSVQRVRQIICEVRKKVWRALEETTT